MGKNQSDNVGGKYGPGIVNNPGWGSNLNYANESRNDKAKPGAKDVPVPGDSLMKQTPNDGFGDKGLLSNGSDSRGQSLKPGTGSTGLFGESKGFNK